MNPVTMQEIEAKCDPQLLVPPRNYHLIAEAVNVNRMTNISVMITERGIRSKLDPVSGSKFIKLLKELKTLSATDTVPEWLTSVLTALGVPSQNHVYYLDTLGSGYDWLKNSDGIDLGNPTTRSMLDLIAAGNPDLVSAINTLKAIGNPQPDPVSWTQCAELFGEG